MATNFPTSVDAFTNPTSNDSLNSPSHSTQHANANDAIEAIETFLLGAGASGLVLISSTTIPSAVSSVTVSNAFSATYDNYYITVTGGVGSATGYFNMQLGSTATGYYRVNILAPYSTGTVSSFASSNATSWLAVFPFTTNSIAGFVDLQNPFNAKNTHFFTRGSQSATTGEINLNSGYLADTLSYTAFTLTTSTGTVTGGTIKVYGIRN